MTEHLNLTHLTTLLTVVEHGGFTRAAQALHLSQSTVSHHIRALEDQLGAALLDRERGGAYATAEGEHVISGARELLATHQRILDRFGDQPAPPITVGATEHAADRLLPLLIDALRTGFPGRDVVFTFDKSSALALTIDRGGLDLALTLVTSRDAPGVPVGELPLRWVAEEGTRWWPPAAGRGRAEIPLVAFENPCGIRERTLRLLRTTQAEARVVAQSATLDGVLTAVRSGLGIALLPVAADVPDGLVEIAELPAAGTISLHLLTRSGFEPAAATMAHDTMSDVLTTLGERRMGSAVDTRTVNEIHSAAQTALRSSA